MATKVCVGCSEYFDAWSGDLRCRPCSELHRYGRGMEHADLRWLRTRPGVGRTQIDALVAQGLTTIRAILDSLPMERGALVLNGRRKPALTEACLLAAAEPNLIADRDARDAEWTERLHEKSRALADTEDGRLARVTDLLRRTGVEDAEICIEWLSAIVRRAKDRAPRCETPSATLPQSCAECFRVPCGCGELGAENALNGEG